MKRLGHLDVYEVTLTTKAPLFVGEGKVYLGTDYLFDGDLRRVQILDQNQFFRMLIRYDLVDRYEHFILGGRKHLSAFLKENPVIPQEEIKAAVLYHVSAAYALTEKYSMKKIFAFTRDAANRVYIPGSTLKGAIRSALLFSMMEKGGGDFSFLDRKTTFPEGRWLDTLRFASDRPGKKTALSSRPARKVFSRLQRAKHTPTPAAASPEPVAAFFERPFLPPQTREISAATPKAIPTKTVRCCGSGEDCWTFCRIPSPPEQSMAVTRGRKKPFPEERFFPGVAPERISAGNTAAIPRIFQTVTVSCQNTIPDTVGRRKPKEYTVAQTAVFPFPKAAV